MEKLGSSSIQYLIIKNYFFFIIIINSNTFVGNGAGFDNGVILSTSFGSESDDFAYSTYDAYPRLIGDVDGDGMDDIIGFESDGIYVSFS